VLPEHVHS